MYMKRTAPFSLAAGNFFAPGREVSPESAQRAQRREKAIREQDSDDILLRRAANGDEDAFAVLYRGHQAALYRFALRMTGSPWVAEEIVQDVFMTLIREPRKHDASRGTVGALLHGITRNRILKHFERLPREVALELAPHRDGGASGDSVAREPRDTHTPHSQAEAAERAGHVRAAILELPAEFREAVVLCELEELSYEEAAQRMDCPVGTVRSRLHRGRVLLLAKLEMLRSAPPQERGGAAAKDASDELRRV